VGDLVRITFAKGYEQAFSTDIFRVVKFILRVPQPVYELSDLQDRCIEGQDYNYELSHSSETEFQIDNIVRTHNKTVLSNILLSGKVTRPITVG